MKSKNKKKLFIIIPFIIAILVFLGLYTYYNYEDQTTSLTAVDKKWLNENKTRIIDFEVVNNVAVYGMNGTGVFFDLINSFEKDSNIEFNKIPYLKENKPSKNSYQIRILENSQELSNNDILIGEDGYVAIGNSAIKINSIRDFSSYNVGVINSEYAELTYYLKQAEDIKYKTYGSYENLFNAIDNKEIDLIIVPYIATLENTIGKSDYHINYYFTEYTKKIVLTLSETENKLNTILKKYFLSWKENSFVNSYNTSLLDYYVSSKSINDKTKTDLLSKNYVYGYIENAPYEVTLDDKIVGIADEYVNRIIRLTDIDFTFKKYSTAEELKKAVDKDEVDIYFDYYNFDNNKFLATTSTFIEKYAVLKRSSQDDTINSLEALKGKTVNMLKSNYLYNYFENSARVNIQGASNISELIKNSKESDTLIVVDYEIYNYYRNTKFKNYEMIYNDYMTNDYRFMIKSDNETFYNLFNYIITTNSYYKYRNTGLSNMKVSIIDRKTFEELYLIVLAIVFIPLFLLGIIYFIIKNHHRLKLVKKEDRKKYTDMLTSLKNRNYLKLQLPEWDDSKVYPQAIIIVDLNNIKYVNNNYGQAKGDQLIVKAASVLVNNQPENSEIIRTDGNEFLIYLVGYSESQVSTYATKLSKEFKDLPYGFGAAVGFSMIFDDIKTIDDAINEATLEMRTDKESYK